MWPPVSLLSRACVRGGEGGGTLSRGAVYESRRVAGQSGLSRYCGRKRRGEGEFCLAARQDVGRRVALDVEERLGGAERVEHLANGIGQPSQWTLTVNEERPGGE